MMSCVTPLRDKILVKYRERAQGIIFIPTEEQFRVADVIEVGEEVRTIKSGQVIKVFEGVAGDEYDGMNFINEKFVLGIMTDGIPKPLGNRIVVLPDTHPDKFGSIYVPDTAKKKMLVGTVVAVGDGRVLDDGSVLPMQVKVGDKVTYGQFAGGYDGFEYEGDNYLNMREEDIFCVLEE